MQSQIEKSIKDWENRITALEKENKAIYEAISERDKKINKLKNQQKELENEISNYKKPTTVEEVRKCLIRNGIVPLN